MKFKETMIKVTTFAIAALAVPLALLAGRDANGDISSIEPVKYAGVDYTRNLGVGEKAYFLVRLVDKGWLQTSGDAVKYPPKTWKFRLHDNSPEALEKLQLVWQPPKIGISVGGRVDAAEYVEYGPVAGQVSGQNPQYPYYTDLYFCYTVKPGDLGLPIKLLNYQSEIPDQGGEKNSDYLFPNVNTKVLSADYLWDLRNDDGELASCHYVDQDNHPDNIPATPNAGGPFVDYSLAKANLKVQAIDFDAATSPTDASIWRDVYPDITDYVSTAPAIEGAGGKDGATLWVWSSDATVFDVASDNPADIQLVSGTNCLKVTIGPGETRATFKLKGGSAAENSTATIYMSSQPCGSYNAVGDFLEDSTVTRTVRVIKAPKPYMSVTDSIGNPNNSIPVAATTNWWNVTEMKVRFSSPYKEGDVEVALNPAVKDFADVDAQATNVIRIFRSRDDVGDSATGVTSVVVPKGETEVIFYVCGLGVLPSAELKAPQITMTPTVVEPAEAAAFFSEGIHKTSTIKVTDKQAPGVTVTTTLPIVGMEGESSSIDVMVTDNWRDLFFPREKGYTVSVSGGFMETSNNVVFVEGETVTFPLKLTKDGSYKATLTVKDPVGNATTVIVPIEVQKRPAIPTVKPALFKSNEASAARDTRTRFCEGEELNVRFVLEQDGVPVKAAETMLAYLVPITTGKGSVSSNLIDAAAYTEPVKIQKDAEMSASLPVRLLDGNETGTTEIEFGVRLTTESGAPVSALNYQPLAYAETLTVTNAAPTFEGARRGNWEDRDRIENGRYNGQVATGYPVTFAIKVADLGIIDATNATTKVLLDVGGNYVEGKSAPYDQTQVVTTNGICYFDVIFGAAGEETVKIYAIDRDQQAAGEEIDAAQHLIGSFVVTVMDAPSVLIEYAPEHPDGILMENGGQNGAYFMVKLSDFPALNDHPAGEPAISANNPLMVKVTLMKTAGDDGRLSLDPYTSTNIIFKTADDAKKGKQVKFNMNDVNGGLDNPSYFQAQARVTTSDKRNAYGVPWSEWYSPSESVEFGVQNANPYDLVLASAKAGISFGLTNTWTAGESVTLQWAVKDIAFDLTNGNFTVGWTGIFDADGQTQMTLTNGWAITGSASKATAKGTFTFVVPDAALTEVTVTADDGEGGTIDRTFWIKVVPTKKVRINPIGPSYVSTQPKYTSQDGIGRGHVYATDGTGKYLALAFKQTWYYNESAKEAHIYAAGYPAAEEPAYDDGKLIIGLSGAPLSPEGNIGSDGNYYDYSGDRDNYFYAWAVVDAENNTSEVSVPMPTTRPNELVDRTFLLDDGKGDSSGSYKTPEIEALFSKEFRPADNGGDMNWDGIPDVYMMKYWKSGTLLDVVYGDAVGNEADLKDLAQTNPDGDFLPGKWDDKGPNKDSYAPIGRPFTTIREIRGFELGLNAQDNLRSDPDFSENEKKAWKAFAEASGLDPAATNLTVWSPEPRGTYPRMDPTLPDTDGDGFDDGWEYYFWYQAHVNVPAGAAKPVAGQSSVFERFDSMEYIFGETIDAKEVENYFNPCEPLSDDQVEYYKSDFDGDGLSDYEEYLIGTNPCHWDTDGDHMCDAWEVMMGLNPLGKSDKATNQDGDFMAEYSTSNLLGAPTADGIWYFDAEGQLQEGLHYVITPDFKVVMLMDVEVNALVVRPFMNVVDGEIEVYGRPDDMPDEDSPMFVDWYFGLVQNPNPELGESWWEKHTFHAGEELSFGGDPVPFVMIHDQVYSIFGFDPRTGWYANENGYVANRWDGTGEGQAGLAVNTREYWAYDEYLVARYRRLFGIYYPGEKIPDSVWGRIGEQTTVPTVTRAKVTETTVTDTNGVESVVTTTESTVTTEIAERIAAAFAAAGSDKKVVDVHGADTDGDGVPDGWELYVYRCPNRAANSGQVHEEMPVVVYTQSGLEDDHDDDGLTFAAEFAGTDACNAYKGCETIYNNHPGNEKGWFNKFFPTDPDNGDTDGDTIPDSWEGSAWYVLEYPDDNGILGKQALSFVYGKPTDNGSCCIRGGGANPCSADTDCDGLPDPWERQYAGLPYDLATGSYWIPALPGGANPDDEGIRDDPVLLDERKVAAGIANKQLTGVIIFDGMDATWGGDAYTDPYDMPPRMSASYDPVTETNRDVDWDHDGLQNWQEYLVQTMRQFRYDDISTPLMGRVLEEGPQHRQQFMDFTPMMQDANDFCNQAAVTWFGKDVLTTHTKTNSMVVTENPWTHVVTTNYVVSVTTNILLGSKGDYVLKHMNDPEWLKAHPLEAINFKFSVPWSPAGWKALGYMSTAAHAWDRAFFKGTASMLYPIGTGVYVSTDPRKADTDKDGMDDFYELFHGLNPLLGGSPDQPGVLGDVIANAYGVPLLFNAYWNEWSHPDFDRAKPLMFNAPGSKTGPMAAPMCYDPVLYPWAIGTGVADPDGDGIRNEEERILANQTSPQTSHTDPTPLWMTDTSKGNSYVSQYYLTTAPVTTLPFWINPDAIGIQDEVFYEVTMKNAVPDFLYSFEQNEGYDTDNDWMADGQELVKNAKSPSSPLNFSDPDRRQAMYFPGKDGYVMSKQLQWRGIDATDMLKQFTVEAWVRPEQTGVDQTVIERSCYYIGDTVTKAGGVIRANFRVGLSADGRVYGMFDNSDAIESGLNQPVSCQRVDGLVLPVGNWSHVALTYDGKALKLYVNGDLCKQAETTLIPATGVMNVLQDPADTTRFPAYLYVQNVDYSAALFIGARPKHTEFLEDRMVPMQPYYVDAFGNHRESFANMREYFKGYVDEVRIWDGARSGSEIQQNYRARMSFADVAANRTTVYQSWVQGATRNDKDGKAMLPAELVHHYNFVTMPGAVNEADVAKVPAGFDKAVAAQVECDYNGARYPDVNTKGLTQPQGLKDGKAGSLKFKDGIGVGWWESCGLRSTVYSDARVVPWIENTVSHLPMLDGSCVDSFLYGDALGGYYLPASAQGVDKYVFPNEAVPYASYNYWVDRYVRLFLLNRLVKECGDTYEPLLNMYRYDIRSRFIGTSDLLPLGGAFAKTCPQMWDDGSAADAWAVTVADDNANGLPDWWEEYARENYCSDLDPEIPLTWDTAVSYLGTEMAAYQAYLIDLARGMQPNGKIDPAYAAKADSDGDNIPDWWENLWGVAQYGAEDDPDNDGLSNFAEYQLSFGAAPYGIENGFPLLHPLQTRSGKDQLVVDYFLPGPEDADASPGNVTIDEAGKVRRHFNSHEYLGEIATDHDFMENWWEKQYKNHYVNSGVYDPQLDTDQDGWSNYAECRAALWCGNYVADVIDRFIDGDMHLAGYPEPAIGVKPFYYGVKNVSGAQLVVRTWTGVSPRVDATFVVAPTAEGTVRVIGGFRNETVMRGFLNPGSVLPSSVVFEKALTTSDKTYKWSWDWYVQNDKGGTDWGAMKSSGTFEEYKALFLQYPHIELQGGDLEWIAFATSVGDAMGKKAKIIHSQTATEIGTIDLKSGEWALDTGKLAACDADGDKLGSSMLRITHASQIGAEWPQAVWLNQATVGRVKQGANTVEAFFDLDGSGAWTPGEPYGVLKNVEIGWHKVPELAIELRDDAVVMSRQALGAGGEQAESGEQEFVIRRTSINGYEDINGQVVPQRQLVMRSVVMDDRPYLTEADVLSGDIFDIDWKWLVSDATEKLGLELKDVRSASYAVEQVAKLPDGTTSNVVVGTFTRNFNTQRSKPVVKTPTQEKPVYSARPTFAFSSSDATMAAYQLQVFSSTNLADKVWDSGVQTLPARQGIGVGEYAYSVTPALYADCAVTTNGSTVFFDGSNYWWRVAMMNAKFNDTSDPACWSELGKFQMDVGNENRYPKFQTGYGSVAAAVRYYGPTNVVEGEVVVEAFENADFTGSALARVRIGDVSTVGSITDITTTNAILRGIEPGTVYLRAYIDQNNNGKRDSWESWGYLNSVGSSVEAIYNPVGVEVVDSLVQVPTCTIYIEDCDLNGDEVPDCLEAEKFTGGGDSSGGAQDGDKDGLTDEDENGFGTDPTLWDTDGDGMPDGWEMAFAGLDPRFYDAEEVIDGDWMAYAEKDATLVTVQNTENPTDTTVYILDESAEKPHRGDTAIGLPLFATYKYEVSDDGALQQRLGRGKPVVLAEEAGKLYRVAQVAAGRVVLVHSQVYDEFGFEPGVAVCSNEHTKAFTALDKYLVVRYLEALGLASEEAMNLNLTPGQQWKDLTLKPLDVDNDRDGVNDGWELYVMFGTSEEKVADTMKFSPWNFDDARDPALDLDGDGLVALGEFCKGDVSTDPWNTYSMYDYLLAKGLLYPGTPQFDDSVARDFGLMAGTLDADEDIDLLTALEEMQGYYLDPEALADLDEKNAWSDGLTPDYFRALELNGETTYMGAIFNGGEFIEPILRKVMDIDTLAGTGTRDYRMSGWDAWSTARYSILNAEESVDIEGVVSDELMLLIRYWNVIRPGEFKGTTVGEAMEFFHTTWKSVKRILDENGDVVVEGTGSISGPGVVLVEADAAQTTSQIVTFFGGQKKMEEVIARNKKDITADEIVTPEPALNLVLKYAGNGSYNVTLEAYQENSAYSEFGGQLSAQWTMPVKFDAGVAKVNEIRTPGLGSLKQGRTRFVAYIDQDGDGRFSTVDTYGETMVNVGYLGADVEIRMGDANLSMPALALSDGTNYVAQFKIVRAAINGEPVVYDDRDPANVEGPHTVYARVYENNQQRAAIYPDDYVLSGKDTDGAPYAYIGVDRNLPGYLESHGYDKVDTVTYEVFAGQGPYTVSNLTEYAILETNTVRGADGSAVIAWATNVVSGSGDAIYTYTVNYSRKPDVADLIVPADQLSGDTWFSFRVPTDTPATKFWIKLNGATYPSAAGTTLRLNGKLKTYTTESGFLLPNAADGVVAIRLDDYIGAALPKGSENRIQIGLGNDRFPTVGDVAWSGEAKFRVGEKAAFDGQLAVIVEHPAVELDANLTVAVYEKADVAEPVAGAVKTGCAAGETVVFDNLRADAEYYVAAWYVKNAADGRSGFGEADATVRMPYDSWGYATVIGKTSNGFDAQVCEAYGYEPPVTNRVWLQDTDWNGNNVIDREEDFLAIGDAWWMNAGGGAIIYMDDFDLNGLPDDYEDQGGGEEESEDLSTSADVMAYFEVPDMTYVALGKDNVESNWVWCAVMDQRDPVTGYRLTDGTVKLQTPADEISNLYSVYSYYGTENNPQLARAQRRWEGIGTNVTYSADWKVKEVRTGKAKFVHAQVYALFGYEPETCVPGSAYHTKAFTTSDKYLVCRYLENIGVAGVDEKLMQTNVNYQWIWSLPPNTVDSDRDGVADGWELYTMFGPNGYSLKFGANGSTAETLTNGVGTIVSPFTTDDGLASAPGAESRLKLIEEYDNGYHPTDPWSMDSDRDGVIDYFAYYYMLKGDDAGEDWDDDGLANYAEYMISEVFKYAQLDPKNPKTDGYCIDYFRKVGDLYLGEIFTDHDQVNDGWEAEHADVANRYVYDANADLDGNGWDNFSEYNAMVSGHSENTVVEYVTNVVNGTAVATPVYGYDGHPTPAIELTLRFDRTAFAANASNVTLVVEAYSELDAPDAMWTVTMSAAELGRGMAKVTLRLADEGSVRQGLNTFMAYVSDATGVYVPGSPFGVVADVDVGWDGAKAEIGLTRTSAVTPRISLWNGESDRVSTINEALLASALRDPLLKTKVNSNDLAWVENILSNRVNLANPPTEGKSMHVRVVRYGIDDMYCYRAGVYGDQYEQRVVLDRTFDPNGRDFLCEADFLADGEFDIDWSYLRSEVVNASGVAQASLAVSNMTYLVVIGDGATSFRGPFGTNTTVNALATMVTRRFEVTRHAPVGENVEAIVHGARPTFRWSIPDEEVWAKAYGTSYTAFKLQILGEDGAVVYDSGVRRAPAQDGNGYFTWTADAYAGDQTSLGKIFAAAGNWKWRVAMYNAKFKPTAARNEVWSKQVAFSTSVGTQQETDDRNYSSLDVAVKYTGPVEVLGSCAKLSLTNGKVRVQAFTTADFSGEPVAQGYIADKAALTDVSDIRANGRLIGLPFGTYYVRAYIDTNGNFKKDVWESWGCAKAPVEIRPYQLAPIVGLYIEDADTDQDWLPDAWEMVHNGSLGAQNAKVNPDGKIVIGTTVYDGIIEGIASFSRFLPGVTTEIFENLDAVKMLLGMGSDTTQATIAAIRDAIQKKIDPDSVRITSMVVDAENGKVILTVGAKAADSLAGRLLMPVYELPTSTKVDVKVYRKENLATAGWGDPVKVVTVTVTSTMEERIEVPLAGVDFSSGFYKVEIEQ